MNKIVECVVNYSEGRNKEVIDAITSPFSEVSGLKLLNVEADEDYNRVVVTVAGDPDIVKEAVIQSVVIATRLIDMTKHTGQHPRMGATDVVPFIPIKNMSMAECVALAKEVGKQIALQTQVPVFLYEAAATASHRENLADIRKGEFEGMAKKMTDARWKPDFGIDQPHPTAGVVAVGARMPLIAFNIDLATSDVTIANKIAKAIRNSSGGYRYIKAGGVEVKQRGLVQVTMNITDYTKTPIYRVFETVKMEALRYGVSVCGSEIVGLVPMEAIVDSAAYYLRFNNVDKDKILETQLEGLI
ncbi:MAG: glutamate formimidoyltransferase [Firmicutes bacterium HGW-Firmicutes-20]|jgi:glutamate formiminotransferase|nr:MAG: glutamate formimidoyltransferase [Firmicutes bacterium HGW-Firmicutes-20]PKM90527.1 MAG: glutamate formimidoyltransferase [Firmicutes bacterium HGW-Firmicutes-10]